MQLFQAHSACCAPGQWIWETRCWGKKETLIGEPADREDGRLVPQNNHLIGVWMPDSFIDQRERSNEELKSKGRIKEMQRGRKEKSSVLQIISKGMPSLLKGCVNLFYSQVGRDKLSPWAEQRHFSLQSSRGAGSFRQAIEYNYNNKSKSKKVSNMESKLASSLQNNFYPIFRDYTMSSVFFVVFFF